MILGYINLTIDSIVAHQRAHAVGALSLLNTSSCTASFMSIRGGCSLTAYQKPGDQK